MVRRNTATYTVPEKTDDDTDGNADHNTRYDAGYKPGNEQDYEDQSLHDPWVKFTGKAQECLHNGDDVSAYTPEGINQLSHSIRENTSEHFSANPNERYQESEDLAHLILRPMQGSAEMREAGLTYGPHGPETELTHSTGERNPDRLNQYIHRLQEAIFFSTQYPGEQGVRDIEEALQDAVSYANGTEAPERDLQKYADIRGMEHQEQREAAVNANLRHIFRDLDHTVDQASLSGNPNAGTMGQVAKNHMEMHALEASRAVESNDEGQYEFTMRQAAGDANVLARDMRNGAGIVTGENYVQPERTEGQSGLEAAARHVENILEALREPGVSISRMYRQSLAWTMEEFQGIAGSIAEKGMTETDQEDLNDAVRRIDFLTRHRQPGYTAA